MPVRQQADQAQRGNRSSPGGHHDDQARLPDGASDQIVRTVPENSRTLKFTSHGFESE